ncbi:RING-H2 finger protein ATL74-like [Tripterygium wilfordii]|nr:RING-H2 finger protein ATL74-like [Tripterygium wilfordii]
MAIVIGLVLLVLGLTLVVLIHVCIVGRVFRRGFVEAGARLERGSTGGSSMSRNDLEKLPCYDYMSNDRASSSPVDCAVCLDNFKDGEKCRMLPICRHSFHSHCIDAWLLRTPNCPICRTSADSSSHFSDSSIDLRSSNTTEISSSSSNFTDVSIDLRESQATTSTDLSETMIDIREMGDLRQSQERRHPVQ